MDLSSSTESCKSASPASAGYLDSCSSDTERAEEKPPLSSNRGPVTPVTEAAAAVPPLAACARKCTTLVAAADAGHADCLHHVHSQVGGDLTPALVAACKKGHVDAVGYAIANGADPNAPDAAGDRPLHHAARNDHAAVIDALVRAGADLDVASGRAARAAALPPLAACARKCVTLADAVGASHIDCLRHVHGSHHFNATPALAAACKSGFWDGALYAISALADVNAPDADGDRPLHHAARAPHIPTLTRLVARRADPALRNSAGETAFDVAKDDEVRALLPCSCRLVRDCIASRHSWCLTRMPEPATALPHMHRGGQLTPADLALLATPHWPEMEGLLCAIGAPSPTFLQPLPTLSPAQRALLDDDDPSAAAIAAAGDVNSPLTYCGSTALHAAAARDNATFARRLIAAGAHLHTTNRFGHTPAHLAAGRSAMAVFALLEDCGADTDGGAEDLTGLLPWDLVSVGACRKLRQVQRRSSPNDPAGATGPTPLHCALRDDAAINRATPAQPRVIKDGTSAPRDAQGRSCAESTAQPPPNPSGPAGAVLGTHPL